MLEILLQTVMSFCGAVGFSLIFNIRGWRVFMNGGGGALLFVVYILIYRVSGSLFAGFFVSTLLIALMCEVLARLTKTPTILMLVPMLVPLIPGGDLYNTMFHLIQQNAEQYRFYGIRLIVELAAINFGIVVSATVSKGVISLLDAKKQGAGN